MNEHELSRQAYAKVTDGDSTRADAWLGQSRVAWKQIEEIDPRELTEEQLEPIESTLNQARRQIDSLGRHKQWKAEIFRILGEIQLRRSDFGAAAKFLEKARTFLPKDTVLVERVAMCSVWEATSAARWPLGGFAQDGAQQRSGDRRSRRCFYSDRSLRTARRASVS